MSNDTVHVVPGDSLTLTIKGKITDPNKANSSNATTLRIYRPAKSSLYAATYSVPANAAVRVDAVFEPDAEIDFDITSRFKNGVHLDDQGRYWMRRPDGWHEMSIKPVAVPNAFGAQFAPKGVQRLKEDKTP